MGYVVVNRLTGQLIIHQNSSIESCDYDPAYWLIDPELPSGVLPQHFKVVGDEVFGMNAEEIAAADLPAAKAAKAAEIESWYNSQLNGGYPTGNGYNLAATVSDQTRFTQDAVLQTNLLSLEMAAGSDIIGFLDATGTPRSMTITAYITLLSQYGQWCRAKLLQQATLLGQLNAATTIEYVNAIDPNA